MSVIPHPAPEFTDLPDDALQRMPPQDLYSERAVLGSMMSSEAAAIECQNAVRDIDYYLPAHQIVHRTIVDMRAAGQPTDPVLVGAELTKRGLLDKVGGIPALFQLTGSVSTPADGLSYAEIVHEKAVLRRLVEAGVRITQAGYAGAGTIDEIMAQAAGEVAAVVEGAGSNSDDDFTLPASSLAGTFDVIEQAGNKTGISGLPTGYTDLDNLTNGLQPGQLIVIAGRPAMGKTTAAMDLARTCAVREGRPAAFLSLEMGIDELNMRLLSAEARVGLHHIRAGSISDDDYVKLAKVTPKISTAPLYVNDSVQDFGAIQSKLRRLKAQQPDLALVVIDYIQLVQYNSGTRRHENRQQEVSEISRGLKLLAKELQVPIVALAQLNRGPEQRADKKPMVSDLRESGAIEQDADIVILLFRDDAYEKESPRAGEVDLDVAKHRNGPTATITVANQLHYSRFVDMAQT